jgi:hypothetical protein
MQTPEETMKQLAKQADFYARLVSAFDAKRLLVSLTPDDALSVAIYGLHLLTPGVTRDGEPIKPLIEVIVLASRYMTENLAGTRYHRGETLNPLAAAENGIMLQSETSDDGAWADEMMEKVIIANGFLSPGSAMLTITKVLHYLSRGEELNLDDRTGDNDLGLDKKLAPSDEVRGVATMLLANFKQVMDAAETGLHQSFTE